MSNGVMKLLGPPRTMQVDARFHGSDAACATATVMRRVSSLKCVLTLRSRRLGRMKDVEGCTHFAEKHI
jgi:hypothetical protein